MPSREEMARKLQTFIDAAGRLRSLYHAGAEWALWEDEVYSYLQRVADQQAATDFHNKLNNITEGVGVTWTSVDSRSEHLRFLDRAVVHLEVVKARVERGDYEQNRAPKVQLVPIKKAATVFIAHSGEPPALSRLADFLKALGVEPVIAERLPFKGRQVPDQARSAMNGCAAAIVFATAADAATDRTQPGRGLLNETGVLQEQFGDKIIYLVEEGVQLGAMLDSYARESFTQECLEKAFHRIVVELKAHRII